MFLKKGSNVVGNVDTADRPVGSSEVNNLNKSTKNTDYLPL